MFSLLQTQPAYYLANTMKKTAKYYVCLNLIDLIGFVAILHKSAKSLFYIILEVEYDCVVPLTAATFVNFLSA